MQSIIIIIITKNTFSIALSPVQNQLNALNYNERKWQHVASHTHNTNTNTHTHTNLQSVHADAMPPASLRISITRTANTRMAHIQNGRTVITVFIFTPNSLVALKVG